MFVASEEYIQKMHRWFVRKNNQGDNEHYWRGLGQVWLGSVSISIGASVTDDHSFFFRKNDPGF